MLLQHFRANSHVERIVLSRSTDAVALEIAAVAGDGDLLELIPRQDVELVGSMSPQSDEHADEVRIGGLGRSAGDLLFFVEPDFRKGAAIELPSASLDGLNLNRPVPAARIRRDDVVMGDVSCECRGDEASPAEFSRDEILPNLLGELIISACRHFSLSTSNLRLLPRAERAARGTSAGTRC